jgi:hypothetical protein
MPKKKATSKPETPALQQAGGCRRPSPLFGFWHSGKRTIKVRVIEDHPTIADAVFVETEKGNRIWISRLAMKPNDEMTSTHH